MKKVKATMKPAHEKKERPSFERKEHKGAKMLSKSKKKGC